MLAFYENRKKDHSAGDHRDGKRKLACSAHLHYHIELVLMVEGKTVSHADTARFEIESGDAFIAFPNQIHRFESTDKERYFIFIINPNLTPELTAVFTNSLPRNNVIKGLAKDKEVLHLAEQLVSLDEDNGLYAKTRRQGYLTVLFSIILSKLTLTETSSSESDTLKAIISYCMQNYQNELSLSVLERDLHINKYYISHLFSDKLRIGFNEYINSLRVSFACHYLRHSNKAVTEIASLVGFNTSRTFNRAFIKQIGSTPSEYRQKSTNKK